MDDQARGVQQRQNGVEVVIAEVFPEAWSDLVENGGDHSTAGVAVAPVGGVDFGVDVYESSVEQERVDAARPGAVKAGPLEHLGADGVLVAAVQFGRLGARRGDDHLVPGTSWYPVLDEDDPAG